MELKEKIDQLGTAFEAFKKANDAEIAQIKAKGHADPLLSENVKKANDAITQLETEIRELKTAMNRQPTQVRDEKTAAMFPQYKGATPFLFKGEDFSVEADREYKQAMDAFIRRGREEKSLSVGTDPNGGYLVRPEVGEMIQTKVFESSPFRKYMGQQTINSDAYEAPTDGDEVAASWVGEQASRSATATPAVGMIRIPVHELMASPKATQKLLDDAGINIEQWLSMKAGDKFARQEATAFASGTGVAQPRGFLTYPAGTASNQIEQKATGSASTFTFDGIMDLVGALKSQYQNGANFFATRTSIALIRKLKDSQNRYLWEPGLQVGKPSALLGAPIEEAADMQEAGANSLSLAFGNFKVGYLIVDRVGVRILRDPYTAKPFVQFDHTKRVGGDVVVTEAIKLLKLG